MQDPNYKIWRLLYGLTVIVFFMILYSFCDHTPKAQSRRIAVALQKATQSVLLIEFYADSCFQLWESDALNSLKRYPGQYKVVDTSINLTFDDKKPKNIGNKLLFVHQGVICPEKNVRLHFGKLASSPFSYQTHVYFAEKCNIDKLYGKWHRENSDKHYLDNVSEGYWVYQSTKTAPYADTSTIRFTSKSPPFMKEKFKGFFIILTRNYGWPEYMQLLQLNDSLMHLVRYYDDGCKFKHMEDQKYKRVK